MTTLKTFILIGVIDSYDAKHATVELATCPVKESSVAILPTSMFPCEIKEGKQFFLLKLSEDTYPFVFCQEENN
jgi:hypothetical protein